jgi:hypothetical protein
VAALFPPSVVVTSVPSSAWGRTSPKLRFAKRLLAPKGPQIVAPGLQPWVMAPKEQFSEAPIGATEFCASEISFAPLRGLWNSLGGRRNPGLKPWAIVRRPRGEGFKCGRVAGALRLAEALSASRRSPCSSSASCAWGVAEIPVLPLTRSAPGTPAVFQFFLKDKHG